MHEPSDSEWRISEKYLTAKIIKLGRKTIRRLLLDDAEECGDRGDFDEEGKGYVILDGLHNIIF